MANFKAIIQSIPNYLALQADVTDLLGTFAGNPSIFTDPAPAGATSPHICVYVLNMDPDDGYDYSGVNPMLQIDIYAKKKSTAYDIASKIDEVLHLHAFPVTDYTNLLCKRTRGWLAKNYEEDEELIGIMADYTMLLEE